ncbi:MAG: hypothetical protein VKL60_06925 [Sphaerospermopsis sp.]|nr:hypothetical protein [Sphaerospermopsis sp.]
MENGKVGIKTIERYHYALKSGCKKENVLEIAEDYALIKNYFNKKMLVFDAS